MGRVIFRYASVALTGVLLVLVMAVIAPASASAAGSGYYVTFAARACPSYQDVLPNTVRDDYMESLEDLSSQTSPYKAGNMLVSPDNEDIAPQTACSPLPGWQFSLGTGYQRQNVIGPWGRLSSITGNYGTSIITQDSTPLLSTTGQKVGDKTVPGAVTVELTTQQRQQASRDHNLWVQGGTPADPVLAQKFFLNNTPGDPKYGFAALRCSTDIVASDNLEYVYFPLGVTHVFCYAYYVVPPPTAGTITIKQVVVGTPAGSVVPAFPFNGNLSYDPAGFTLTNGGADDFYRADSSTSGITWDVAQGNVPNYPLQSIVCSSAADDSTWNASTNTAETAIHLAAGDHVTCVYTNVYGAQGGLTIRKQTVGGTGSFNFDVTPAGGGSSQTVTATTSEQGVPVAGSPVLSALPTGQYKITEAQADSTEGTWALTRVSCSVGGGAAVVEQPPVEVAVAPNQSTVCTFLNTFTPRGSITIDKTTLGGTGDVKFLIERHSDIGTQYLQTANVTSEGVPTQAKPDTDADSTDHLDLGAYTITEQEPPSDPTSAWSLDSVECDGTVEPFAEGSVEVQLTAAHPHLRCSFTNSYAKESTPPNPTVPTPPEPIDPSIPGTHPVSDLSVTKVASAAAVAQGNNVTYTITVKNRGPDPAEQVSLTDSPSKAPVVVSIRNPTGGACTVDGTIVCSLGTLKAGESVALTVVLNTDSWSGSVINRAAVGTSTPETTLANNVSQATIKVVPQSLALPEGLG